MRYNDSFEQSAEYLRLALPLMSRQEAALHPLSYAVWYEYVAGFNPGLKQAVDTRTSAGNKLDEASTLAIYRQYVSDLDAEVAQRMSTGIQRVLSEMSQSAETAGQRADQYGNALERWVDTIGELSVGGEIVGLEDILSDTRQMRSAVVALAKRLEDSRHEIEVLRQEVTRARADALADALTGLVNRKGFDLAIGKCLAGQGEGSRGASLVAVDIDHFKKVNDDFGHLFGDKVLRSVARILKDNVKGKDTVARYGGEEFFILLPDTSIQGAHCLADNIRSSVERCRVRRMDSQETVARVTVSLGVAAYRPGESTESFLRRADEALYASKRDGRNRVTLAGAKTFVRH